MKIHTLEMTILLTTFCRHALLFEDIDGEYNIDLAKHAKSIREFDDALTRGMQTRSFLLLKFLVVIIVVNFMLEIILVALQFLLVTSQ